MYVGSATNLYRRKTQHFSDLHLGKHSNQKLQRAYAKYGPDAFMFDVLEYVLIPEMLTGREQHFIDTLKPWFNIARVAGSHLGMKHTPETREKLRKANLGKPGKSLGVKRTPEQRAQMSKSKMGNTNLLGFVFSPESRAKMSASHKGQVSPNRGKPAPPGTIAKMNAARVGKPSPRLGKKNSPEHNAKVSAARKGKPNPHTGVKHTPEARAKIAAASTGRKHRPAAKEKLRLAQIGNDHGAKDYIVTSPEGVEYKVHGLSAFCKEHNLTQQVLSSVASGKRTHHKGWTARYFEADAS
jgi:group I intron endonuclease